VLFMAETMKKTQKLKLEQTMKDKDEIKKVLKKQKEWKENAKKQEALKWKNYNEGIERIAKNRQKTAMIHARREVERKNKLKTQRMHNLEIMQKEKQENIDKYDKILLHQQNISKDLIKKGVEMKQTKYKIMRNMKQNARSKYLESKPYEQKMEAMRKEKKGS